MLKTFKTGGVGQLAAIVLTLAALWWPAFARPVTPENSAFFSPLYELLYRWLVSVPRFASAAALLLVVCEGLFLNMLLVNHKITNSHSLLPMFLYIVLMSWNPEQLTLTPALLVNLIVLCSISQLLSNGGTSLPSGKNFNTSMLIAIASLTYLPAITLIIPYLIVYTYYKLYKWRDIAVGILGMAAPFIVFATYAYLDDKLIYYWFLSKHDIGIINLKLERVTTLRTATSVILAILTLVSLIHVVSHNIDNVAHQRINTGVLSLPIISAILISCYCGFGPFVMQLFAPSFAFILTVFLFVSRRREWIGDVLLWIIPVAAVVNSLFTVHQ